MTRLQVLMQREIGGWPVYTIIIAFGQVRLPAPYYLPFPLTVVVHVDAECNKFPDHTAFWTELARDLAGVCPWWYILGRFGDLVCTIQAEAIGLDPHRTMVLLCGRVLPHRVTLHIVGL